MSTKCLVLTVEGVSVVEVVYTSGERFRRVDTFTLRQGEQISKLLRHSFTFGS